MTTIEVQPYRGKWRVVMRSRAETPLGIGDRITVLGTFNAKFKAEHEAEQHRQKLADDDG